MHCQNRLNLVYIHESFGSIKSKQSKFDIFNNLLNKLHIQIRSNYKVCISGFIQEEVIPSNNRLLQK